MPVPVDCPCGRRMMVRDDSVGKKARCPKCGAVVPVPEPVLEGELVEDYGGLEIVGGDELATTPQEQHRQKQKRQSQLGRKGAGFNPSRVRGSTKSLLPGRPSKHHAPIRGSAGRAGLPAWEMLLVLGAVAVQMLLWIAILTGAFKAEKATGEVDPLGIWMVILAIPTVLIPGFSLFGLWIRSEWGSGLALLRGIIGGLIDVWLIKEGAHMLVREDLPSVFIIDVVLCAVAVGLLISCKGRGAYN